MNTKQLARIAGFLYLTIAIGAGFGYGYVQEVIFVSGDPTSTFQNILNAKTIFQLTIIASVIGFICDIAVAAIFYYLLRPVSKIVSFTAALLRVTQTAILGTNLLTLVAASTIASGALSSSTQSSSEEMVSMLLTLHDQGFNIAMIFFGMHCVLIAYLLWKSELFPKWLGALVGLAALGYLVDSPLAIVLPEYAHFTETFVVITALTGELALVFWLLIKGVRKEAQ